MFSPCVQISLGRQCLNLRFLVNTCEIDLSMLGARSDCLVIKDSSQGTMQSHVLDSQEAILNF